MLCWTIGKREENGAKLLHDKASAVEFNAEGIYLAEKLKEK